MANRFADRADFLMVYIAEAHAADKWPVGDPVVANQPKRLKERLSLANSFVSEYSIDKEPLLHMVVDNLSDMSPHESDPADRAYAFWPTRFYVVDSYPSTLCARSRSITLHYIVSFLAQSQKRYTRCV